MHEDYQAGTAQTSIYPDAGKGTSLAKAYALSGLTSECGELLLAAGYEDVIKEFGDVLWYIARLCEETKAMHFSELVLIRTQPEFSLIGSTMVMGLSRIADAVKKTIRDGEAKDDELRHKRKELIQFGLITIFSSALSFVEYTASAAGYNKTGDELLALAIEKNVDKLADRKERNVLEGSGDGR